MPESFEVYADFINPAIRQTCDAFVQKFKALPETPETFGVIHGDFGLSNIFSEWDKVWVFDFDDCCYGFYMFDVACAIIGLVCSNDYPSSMSHVENRYGPDGIFAHFRKGYESVNTLPEEQREMLDDFCALRFVELISMMSGGALPKEVRDQFLLVLIDSLMHHDNMYAYLDELCASQAAQS